MIGEGTCMFVEFIDLMVVFHTDCVMHMSFGNLYFEEDGVSIQQGIDVVRDFFAHGTIKEIRWMDVPGTLA